jgi:hypothetical protein
MHCNWAEVGMFYPTVRSRHKFGGMRHRAHRTAGARHLSLTHQDYIKTHQASLIDYDSYAVL